MAPQRHSSWKLIGWPNRLVRLFAAWYDWIAAPQLLHRAEHLMAQLAVWGFGLHCIMIGCAWVFGGHFTDLVGTNWLAPIYTPFAFILVYEVLLLLLAIPESTTRALALQFQIVSLIVVRNSFKDLATLDEIGHLLERPESQLALAFDMGGGVILFGLVAIFYWVAGRPSAYQSSLRTPSPALEHFIARKKAVAFTLSIVFTVLVLQSVARWSQDAWGALTIDQYRPADAGTTQSPFFRDLFTAMILADVLILILSLQLSDAYQQVFRGAGFVIATILLRISLSAERPLQIGIAISAVVFSVVVLAIYKAWPRDPWATNE